MNARTAATILFLLGSGLFPGAVDAASEESLRDEVKKDAGRLLEEAEERVKKIEGEVKSAIARETPVVEDKARSIVRDVEEKAVEWRPVIREAEERAAGEVEAALGAGQRRVEQAKTSAAAGELWLMAYLHQIERHAGAGINDQFLRLNLVSPGLGTYLEDKAADEARYLKRAATLAVREGGSEADQLRARALSASRDALDAAGHWVKEESHKVHAAAESEEVRIKRDILRGENKADFYLDGRPLSDAQAEAVIAHHNLLVTNEFPSATQCAECHPGQYREWSVSQHAYAQLSPVFNAMSERINRITNGTNGDFCIRCHTPVGMAVNEPIFTPNEERLPVTREGVTCVACHRVENAYGRVSSRFGMEKGNITKPMYGPLGPDVLNEVIDKFEVTTDMAAGALNWKEGGKQVIHDGAVKVKTFSSAQLCSNCHDVNSQNTFRLEEAYSQFRNSPAAKDGHVCQDCHMGSVLGEVSPYNEGPVAFIGGVPTPKNKRTNHMFAGPDYSIVHPGIFPHNPEAESIASFREWLQFDVEAGWGTKDFESVERDAAQFPPAWRERRHRMRAAEFIRNQLTLLGEIRAESFRTLRFGYQLGKFRVTRNDAKGVNFELEVKNATSGHGAPTGFDAEREVFLHVVVRDADGRKVFESGDRDPNGDVRNLHSSYVRAGKAPLDGQLFSLQSKFLELIPHGGERERILPIPVAQGPLPFLRPNESSGLQLAHPTDTRKQASIIPPLGKLMARYKVGARELTGRPPYRVEMTFIAQMVPVNLINEIASVGFDYGLSPRDVANRVVMGAFPLWHHEFELGAAGWEKDLTPTREQVLGPDAVKPALPWLKLPQSWLRELDGQAVTSDVTSIRP